MLTIDWKERLTQDTKYYLEHKLPHQDYDFEIIFNAYPERTRGRIPNEVISFIAGIIVQSLGKKHAEQIPFFRFLWLNKGDYGKVAFGAIMAKLAHKKPELYIPLIEEMMAKAEPADITALLDKVILPLCRKHPEKYLSIVLGWNKRSSEEIIRQTTNLCIKLIKRRTDLIPEILNYFENQWVYPLGEHLPLHIKLLKTVAQLDPEAYLGIWREFGISRDPEIVELLCASILDYHSEIEPIIELWTKSGNARVKKASTTAMRLIKRKKEPRA